MKRLENDSNTVTQITESWRIKTLHDFPPPQQQQRQDDDVIIEPIAAVADLPSTSNQRNPVKWVDKNRRRSTFKPRFVEQSEAISSNSVEEECCGAERAVEVQEEASELKDETVNCTTTSENVERNEELVDVDDSFRELRSSIEEEPNLYEEQLNLNLQLQEDELLALESIYGDNATTLDRQSGLLCLKIHIHIVTPNEIHIVTNLNFSSELTCLLPKSYPSHRPPYFTISVKWLDSEITLGPYGTKHEGDSRAISGNVAPDADIVSLKNYNDTRCHEDFVQNFHECCICFSEYTGAEFIRLPCQHFFCGNCTKIFVGMHVKERTVCKLLCPNTKCDVMFPPNVLKRLLKDEEYQRWESLMLEKTLDLMSDIAYCPRCETDKRHVGDSCMAPEIKLHILQERQNSSQLQGRQKAKEFEMINEILSIKEILRDAKQCPSCKIAINRTEGCNKMVCYNCGKYFCYRCNLAIGGYDHFGDGGYELFSEAMFHNWEEQMNPRQLRGMAQAQIRTGHGQTCPYCLQFNPKIGNNNHLFCGACQARYCYLCRKVVRCTSEHFGTKRCKHTPG